jgi:hypothetical protein
VSDTVASVVLLLDIFSIITAVKVLIRLIAWLRQLPPDPPRRRRRVAVACADAPAVRRDERCARDGLVPQRPG